MFVGIETKLKGSYIVGTGGKWTQLVLGAVALVLVARSCGCEIVANSSLGLIIACALCLLPEPLFLTYGFRTLHYCDDPSGYYT